MNSQDCIFCKIVKKEIPSKVVFENDSNLAFLDIHPISEGHTIVIPKNHYRSLEDLPDEEINRLFQTTKKVAKMIHERLDIDGYNIIQNNFRAAGQVVNHSHIHIIPRRRGDMKIKLDLPKKEATEEELKAVLEKLNS